jgi:hypothetical protein
MWEKSDGHLGITLGRRDRDQPVELLLPEHSPHVGVAPAKTESLLAGKGSPLVAVADGRELAPLWALLSDDSQGGAVQARMRPGSKYADSLQVRVSRSCP